MPYECEVSCLLNGASCLLNGASCLLNAGSTCLRTRFLGANCLKGELSVIRTWSVGEQREAVTVNSKNVYK